MLNEHSLCVRLWSKHWGCSSEREQGKSLPTLCFHSSCERERDQLVKYKQGQSVVNELDRDKIKKEDRKWGECKTRWSGQASLRTWRLKWRNKPCRYVGATCTKALKSAASMPGTKWMREWEGDEARGVTGRDQGGPCGQMKRFGLFLWARQGATGADGAKGHLELTWCSEYFGWAHFEILH